MGRADAHISRQSSAADEPEQKQRQPEPDPQTITHFSHVHTLNKIVLPQQLSSGVTCDGCWLPYSGVGYGCVPCDYVLHESCATAPQRIEHPAHARHPLVFSVKAPYPEGTFTCDACGKQGTGFCFRCPICCFDLHVPCATLPHQVMHPYHGHQLSLLFSIPYPIKAFNCDVCRLPGIPTRWLYHCAACGFDTHLHCATSPPPIPHHVAKYLNPSPSTLQQQQHIYPSTATLTSPHPNPYSNLLANQEQELQQLLAYIRAQSAMQQRFTSEMLRDSQQPPVYGAMMPGYPGQSTAGGGNGSGSTVNDLLQQLANNGGGGQGLVGSFTSLLSGNGGGGLDLGSLASMFFS